MSRPHPTSDNINLSYHPNGSGSSPSLIRARQPFRFGNALIGLGLAGFGAGIYVYSIAAVKQDDFSDVEDLLPPLVERSKLRSIEDEERERLSSFSGADPSSQGPNHQISNAYSRGTANTISASAPAPGSGSVGAIQTSSPTAMSSGLPGASSSPSSSSFTSPSSSSSSSGTTTFGQDQDHTSMSTVSSGSGSGSLVGRLLPRRLSEMGWAHRAGLIEKDTGNAIVWGAPNVDRLGKMGQPAVNKGPRVV